MKINIQMELTIKTSIPSENMWHVSQIKITLMHRELLVKEIQMKDFKPKLYSK